ncbi:uncharacterized protein LOC141601871 [Silene latifolia]|uniref:uncharacterized protein LOC141601871 n=1 Tax=Silene latifolia TaxID=37657 RepID=UPI003D76F85C
MDTLVYSRLDRCVSNSDWVIQFPESYAYFMPEGTFDHCPCVIYLQGLPNARKQSFKYFNMWALDANFKQVVTAGWNRAIKGNHMFQHVKKLKGLKFDLKALNKGNLGDIENKVKVAKLALFQIQEALIQNPIDNTLIVTERDLSPELIILQKAWHMFLDQKAKIDWINVGDDNTHYFHAHIKTRRARNKVLQIYDHEGNMCTSSPDIQNDFIKYYEILLGSSKHVDPVCATIMSDGPVLNMAHHEILLATVTPAEVRNAMFDIGGNKAPGPDGFSSQFYKDTWDITGDNVTSTIQEFFANGKLHKQVNSTLITLVPKVELPSDVTQFRPIACCNSIYKCISKIICNRMSTILPNIINPSQSAFIKGRDIVENILICQDLVKMYNRKAVSPRVIMKNDLQKAYDSIEWSFVDSMLRALNFTPSFINLLMECITSPTYSLSLNGESFGYFPGKRGLRGDRTSIIGMSRAFESFSRASSLKMNKGKSSLYSNAVTRGTIDDILKITGMSYGTLPFKYLGIPIAARKLSVLECTSLVDKVVCGIRYLGSRKLSYAGHLEHICQPKTHGGLDIKDIIRWNKAALGKYIWWLAHKKDHFWVRWIHSIYIKNGSWFSYDPKQNGSWAWRKLCKIRDLMVAGYVGDWWLKPHQEYTIASGYDWLSPPMVKVNWTKFVWIKDAHPKHSFIGWLVMHERLLTRDRLKRMGIIIDDI